MKKLSEVYKEAGIDFTFPIEIKDSNGNEIYFENSKGYYYCVKYDNRGNEIYYENSDGYWWHREWDKNGKETYFENSEGYTRGTKRQSCHGKVIEVDGKKYKLKEL